jgi:hypothetical protein
MAGTFTGKTLAHIDVPSTIGALYTAPALTVAYVRNYSFYNTSAVTQTLIVSRKISGGTAYECWRASLLQNESVHSRDGDEFTLGPGDSVQAVTTTASAVRAQFHGVEET